MDATLIENEFPHINNLTYLNHAAVAPWPQRTRDAVKAFADQNAALGAKHYPRWAGIELQLRQRLATLINAPSLDDIALLKSTSEALSVVAYGLTWQTGDNIVTSNQEFPSNRIVWESLRSQGVALKEADLDSTPTPEQALIEQVDQNTRMITISSVQYATGLKMNLEVLGEFCRENNILFCVDAIQSIGAQPVDVQSIDADFVMADGHKWMLAAEGLALFYCKEKLRDQLKLNQYGWHMVDPLGNYDTRQWHITKSARRFECGSPNMIAAHALHSSVGLILEVGIEEIEHQLAAKTAHLVNAIESTTELALLSSNEPQRRGGIVTFSVQGADHPALYKALMDNDVICAHRGGGIRFSPHFYTPTAQLDSALETAIKLSR